MNKPRTYIPEQAFPVSDLFFMTLPAALWHDCVAMCHV
jgi:hypothetical protein